MKTTEELKNFKAMTVEALEKELDEQRKKLAHESLKIQAGKSDKSNLIQKYKKDIARILTIIREK